MIGNTKIIQKFPQQISNNSVLRYQWNNSNFSAHSDITANDESARHSYQWPYKRNICKKRLFCINNNSMLYAIRSSWAAEAAKEHKTYQVPLQSKFIDHNINYFPYKKSTISLFETIYAWQQPIQFKCYVIWIVMALSCMLLHRLRQLMSSWCHQREVM